MDDFFMTGLKTALETLLPNKSVTENGAVGYKTTGKALCDMNFMLSSMRNMDEEKIWRYFLAAYNENPVLAMRWLFFARDILEGCGERRVFRAIMLRLSQENADWVVKTVPLVPEYGRWDDLIDLWDKTADSAVKKAAETLFTTRLREDLENIKEKKPISLLGKWLPSENTSSKATRALAGRVREALGISPKNYRRMLSVIRGYLRVVERDMSSNQWGNISYGAVPSKAAMVYRFAFGRHDGERYFEYLESLKSGDEKINAKALYPYEIVHSYRKSFYGKMDETLEAQWMALPNTVGDKEGASTLVVVDGSASMLSRIGRTGVTAEEVAYSLGIYFSEKLKGPYKDTFITFSENPRLVTFKPGLSLLRRLQILEEYDECANTNIEKVFDMVLITAQTNHLKQSEIPSNILIITDGEFDEMTYQYKSGHADKKLFDAIRERWDEAGYKLPRLVFWNVNSRTGTIPIRENNLGVALVSGFSPNIADMVLSGELDPYKCLVSKLSSARYDAVEAALKQTSKTSKE